MAKNNTIFTEKSLNTIKSPESLNDYIRVANPSVWLLIASIIVLLLGACIWGIFGKIESKVVVFAKVNDNVAYCDVEIEDLFSIKEGMTVRINDTEGRVSKIDVASNVVEVEINLENGFYEAEIIKEVISPMSFVTN